mgnify:CR=1 FL=1
MGMTGALEIDVTVSCPAWIEAVPGVEDVCRDAARAACAANGATPASTPASTPAGAEASLVLADDRFMRALNRDYRNLDEATNVLAFANADAAGDDGGDDAPGAPRILGDVVVAYETAAAEATRSRTVLADHLCHLVVHGILHLLGHDHETNADAERMEGLEIRALASLGVGLGDPVVPGDDERR